MNQSLTVVLPVRNAESTLGQHVAELLEIGGEITSVFRLYIVDDGSTDDTYDTAVEISSRFPQVRVTRNSHRRGLGSTLRQLRSQAGGGLFLVHDGVSEIDSSEIRQLWLEHVAADDSVTMDDLHRVSAAHSTMELAHSRISGFHKVLSVGNATDSQDANLSRREAGAQTGVGAIPPLPRPNFMGSLANFALGE